MKLYARIGSTGSFPAENIITFYYLRFCAVFDSIEKSELLAYIPHKTAGIIFITLEDIFEKDLAKYTFTEQCEEIQGLHLEDGTSKIFLNMTSKNGEPKLVSLLQYMRNTRLDNPEIVVRDKRLLRLDEIVGEVRQSEEWEAVKMNILEIGIAQGEARGEIKGEKKKLINQVCRKLQKGKTVEIIAEELEEEMEVIEQICGVAGRYAPAVSVYCGSADIYAAVCSGWPFHGVFCGLLCLCGNGIQQA